MDGVPGSAEWRACIGLAAFVALCTEVGQVAAQDSAITAQSQSALTPRVVAAQKLSRNGLATPRPVIDQDGNLDRQAKGDGPVGKGDAFALRVTHLEAWAAQNPSEPAKLVLYLDGQPLPDELPQLDLLSRGYLVFVLARTSQTKEVWKALMGRPTGLRRTFRVTVGTERAAPFESDATLTLHVLRAGWIWASMVTSAVLVVLLITFWKKASRLLRNNTTTDEVGSYSLARVQMAWWFVSVVVVYLGIYAVTGYYDVLSGSVLALIGISSGTAAFASVVDNSGRNEAEKRMITLQDQVQKLERKIAALTEHMEAAEQDKRRGDIRSKHKAIDAKRREIHRLKRIVNPRSNGFPKDILTFAGSETGLHRLQMIVWTLVLWVIFMIETYRTLAMPEFSGELLALMGISSGTYVGFKAATQ